MRRKKDDKRVLRPGNGNYDKKTRRSPFNRSADNKRNSSIRQSFLKGNNNNRQNSRQKDNYNKHNKHNGKIVLVMILILFAFIIGAGAGVFMSFEDNNSTTNNTTYVKNVTVEMTTNLNESNDEVVFDESDQVDYNENESSKILGVEDNPYYNKVPHLY